jgi:hypothetical protein
MSPAHITGAGGVIVIPGVGFTVTLIIVFFEQGTGSVAVNINA